MSDFYQGKADLATRLITKRGQPISMTKKGKPAGGRDPITGLPTPAEPDVTISGHGIKLSYTKAEVDGESVIFGDCKLKFVGETPIIGMITTIDGEDWRVMKPNPLTPAGITLLYDVQLRRG